jgi:DNA-binding transcriptional ArsR family regulator
MTSAVADLEASTFVERVAKAMSHPLRLRILTALNQRPMSPSQFQRAFGREGESLSRISRQFRKLESYHLIEEIEQKSGGSRRGGVEHVYRSIQVTEIDTPIWAVLPYQFKRAMSAVTAENMGIRIAQALESETIDARSNRHLSWMTVPLDQQGWDHVIAQTDAHFEWVRDEAVRAGERLAESSEEPILTTVALAAFESPPESERTDPNP